MSFAVCARLNWGQRGRACDVCGRETQRVAKNRAKIRAFLPRTFLPYTLLCLELGRLAAVPYLPNLIQLPINDLHECRRQVGPLGKRRVQDVVRRRAGRPQYGQTFARVFGGLPQHGEKRTF